MDAKCLTSLIEHVSVLVDVRDEDKRLYKLYRYPHHRRRRGDLRSRRMDEHREIRQDLSIKRRGFALGGR
jgi:hypothetical protein